MVSDANSRVFPSPPITRGALPRSGQRPRVAVEAQVRSDASLQAVRQTGDILGELVTCSLCAHLLGMQDWELALALLCFD